MSRVLEQPETTVRESLLEVARCEKLDAIMSLRDSTESIDTENVLLPLLERLGINVPKSLYADNIQPGTRSVDSPELLSDHEDCDYVSEKQSPPDKEEIVYFLGDNGDDCSSCGTSSARSWELQGEETCNDYDEGWESSSSDLDDENVDIEENCNYIEVPVSDIFASLTLQDCTNRARHHGGAFSKPMSHAAFVRRRVEMARKIYEVYNDIIFDTRLPKDMDISWNARLSSTAGLTHYRRAMCYDAEEPLFVYSARIELSIKVLDNVEKLERTLIHEMCHCATWLIDHIARPPHGEHFKKYAQRAMLLVPHVDVSTCHNYQIFYPFRWQCVSCLHQYGRHSKSIDVTKKSCGQCRGTLTFLGRFSRDGSPQKHRISAYSAYVKENFARVKESLGRGKNSASDVIKVIAEEWKFTQG